MKKDARVPCASEHSDHSEIPFFLPGGVMSQQLDDSLSVIPTQRKAPTPLNKKKALRMLQSGATHQAIAEELNVHRVTISRFSQSLSSTQKELQEYQGLREAGLVKVQALAQRRQVEILEDDELWKKLQPADKVKALSYLNMTFGTSFDKERLVNDQSTSNTSLIALVKHCHEEGLFTKEELHGGDGDPS